MHASDKDVAEYIRLLLRLGRIDKRGIIQWADTIVATRGAPPLWAMDLSMAAKLPLDTVDSLLGHVDGQITDDLPER